MKLSNSSGAIWTIQAFAEPTRIAVAIAITALLMFFMCTRSATADDDIAHAECQTAAVKQRIEAIDREIAQHEAAVHQISGSPNTNVEYNDPSGRIPDLARKLKAERDAISDLRWQRRRWADLPPCLDPEVLDFTDICFSSDVEEEIDELSGLISKFEADLAEAQKQAEHAGTLYAKGIRSKGNAALANEADDAIKYDQYALRALKAKVAALYALPACGKEHNALRIVPLAPVPVLPPVKELPKPKATPGESDERPEIGSNPHKHKHPCREDEACAMEGVAVKPHETSGGTSAPVSNGATVVVPSDNGSEGEHEEHGPEYPNGPDHPSQPDVPLPPDSGPHE